MQENNMNKCYFSYTSIFFIYIILKKDQIEVFI